MTSKQRREILLRASALAAGGAGYAMSGSAAAQARTPFTVAPTFIPIAGSGELFPVRRIYCIGRNYAAHAREMGSDPTREPPFFFQKPTDAVQNVPPGATGENRIPSLWSVAFAFTFSSAFVGSTTASFILMLVISAAGAMRRVRDPTGALETLRTVRIACTVATRERSSCGSVTFRSYF